LFEFTGIQNRSLKILSFCFLCFLVFPAVFVPCRLSGLEGQAHAGLQICAFLSFVSFPAAVREGLSVFSNNLSWKVF
jgi:hypothetical protein